MGRRAKFPPVPHRHGPTGQARVRHAGRDHYLGPWDSEEARRNYVALVRELEVARAAAPPPPGAGTPTIRLVLSRWKAHALEAFGAANPEVRAYEDAFRELRSLFGGEPAPSLDCDRLEQVRDAMIAAGLCRNVVNRRVGRIKTAWRWADRRGHAPKGSWAALRALPPLRRGEKGVSETARVSPVGWPAVAAVCRRVRPSVRGLLLAQWFTGARPGELWPMRAGDLEIRGGVGTYRPSKHKNAWRGHDRVIQFGPKALRAIRDLLAAGSPGGLVFPTRDGVPYRKNSYGLAVSRAAKRAGVSLHAYQLRHSAKRRFTRELGLDSARAALGQSCLSTTDRYAAGGDEQAARDVARRCG